MQLLSIPAGSAARLHKRFDVKKGERLRISYISGTGDVVGTYAHWRDGRHDPRVPVITYSTMFYELMSLLDASAQIITPWPAPLTDTKNLTFCQIAREDSSSRAGAILNKIQYIRRCIAAVDAFHPHVVIADTDFQPLGWGYLKRNRSLVISAHNTFWAMGQRPSSGLKSSIKTRILYTQAKAIDGAVCTSEECRRQISEITHGRIDGFVEFPQIEKHHELERRSLARKLLYLGRIEVDKGVFLLLDAFASVEKHHPKMELVFAGSGTAEGELTSRIAALARDNIRFVGRLDAEKVHQTIASSDLIVCPTTSSFNEGLALVGFEGAAHGIPTLLSSVVPAADALGRGCMVFEADDTASLQQRLITLATDAVQYRALAEGTLEVHHLLYDRERSWGRQLCSALLAL